MHHNDHRKPAAVTPFRPALFALSGFILLAACGPVATPPPAAQAPAPETLTSTTVQVVEPVGLPDPARLMGLNPREVQALVGAPTLVRRDDKVQVMLFENGTCVLEIVYFEPDSDSYFEARHISARTSRGADTDTATCLAALLPHGRWRGE